MPQYLVANTPMLNQVLVNRRTFQPVEAEQVEEIQRLRQSVEISATHQAVMQQAAHETALRAQDTLYRQLAETQEMRDGIQELNTRQHAIHATGLRTEHTLRAQVMETRGMHDTLRQQVAETQGTRLDIQQLDRNLYQHFHGLNIGLRQGFSGVTQAIVAGHQQLGEQITQGFGSLAQGQQRQTQILDAGLQRLGGHITAGFQQQMAQIAAEGQLTRKAIGQVGEELHLTRQTVGLVGAVLHEDLQQTQAAIGQVGNILIGGFNAVLGSLAREGLLQRQAIENLRISMEQRMDKIHAELARQSKLMQNPDYVRADEHFRAAFWFMNGLRLDDAKSSLDKALRIFAGHYPSLMLRGYLAWLDNRVDAAQADFDRARSQAMNDDNPARIRLNRSAAALYLARLAFARGDYSIAGEFYSEAYENNPELFSAMVEAAVCHILYHRHHQEQKQQAFQQVERNLQRERMGKMEYRFWYALALELSGYDAQTALQALRKGLSLIENRHAAYKRVKVIHAEFYQLNPRMVGRLLELIKNARDLGWLIV